MFIGPSLQFQNKFNNKQANLCHVCTSRFDNQVPNEKLQKVLLCCKGHTIFSLWRG